MRSLYVEENNQTIDVKELERQGYTDIHFQGVHLVGAQESTKPYHEYFFGESDSQAEFIESKPVYRLIGETDYDTLDSKESLTQTLCIFLNSNTLTLLNYSLLDSSLNIKLECHSKESQEPLEKEQAQREQEQANNEAQSSQSTSMLHPVLEDNEIKCPHNGVVKLKANKGKPFSSNGIPMILESDLLNASITGCANPILSGGPCTMVATILPTARGLKKYNDDYPIMQDLVPSGCLTDKGLPLVCTPKANTLKINSPNPNSVNNKSQEEILAEITLSKPLLRLHYKIHSYQKDNLPIYKINLNDNIIESDNEDEPLESINIDITNDTKELSDTSNLDSSLQDVLSNLYSNLKESYIKNYEYKYLHLQLDSNSLILILLIPQSMPKVFKKAYEEYEYKEYGAGRYNYIYSYCTHIELKDVDYTQVGLGRNSTNAYILTLHTPYKAQKLELYLASGLDSIIESKDANQDLDNILTIKVVNTGHKEKWWGYGVGGEEDKEYAIQEK